MLGLITETVLDITFGTVWWMGKKTVSGIGYLISLGMVYQGLFFQRNIIDRIEKLRFVFEPC